MRRMHSILALLMAGLALSLPAPGQALVVQGRAVAFNGGFIGGDWAGPYGYYGGSQMPMEVLLAEAEVVVVGKITAIAGEKQMQLKIPENGNMAWQGPVRVATVKVEKTLRGNLAPATAPAEKPAAGGAAPVAPAVEIAPGDVVDQAMPFVETDTDVGRAPAVGPVGVAVERLAVQEAPKAAGKAAATTSKPATAKAGGKAADKAADKPESIDVLMYGASYGNYHAHLRVGTRYAFVLRKLEGRKDFWLSPNPALATEDIAAVEKAVDIDKWNWGKESNGLRCIVLSAGLNPAAGGYSGGAAASGVWVPVTMGLRNVSKEPLFVDVYPPDNYLDVRAFWDGTAITARLPSSGGYGPGMQFSNTYVAEIKPGGVIWVSPYGRGANNTSVQIDSPPGKCQIKAVYSATREAEARQGHKLWKGKVESALTEIEIPGKKDGW